MTFNSGGAWVLLLTMPALMGCEPDRPPNAAPGIATTITTRCGTCHRAPEPGTRARESLGPALSRHRKRVRLTEEQWDAVLGYLARGSGATTPTQLDR
jgi:hypothetical protein